MITAYKERGLKIDGHKEGKNQQVQSRQIKVQNRQGILGAGVAGERRKGEKRGCAPWKEHYLVGVSLGET